MPTTPILLDENEAVAMLGSHFTPEIVRELIDAGEIAVVRIRGVDYIVSASITALARRAERRARRQIESGKIAK